MEWKKNHRADGRIEWLCSHGIGHTCIASAILCADRYKEYSNSEHTREEVINAWMMHGCDGCCGRDDFPCSNGTCELCNKHKKLVDEYKTKSKDRKI